MDTKISAGTILRSSVHLEDAVFAGTVLLIARQNPAGTVGFIINKIFERTLNELAEFAMAPAMQLYNGGPVAKEQLFFIHRRNDVIGGGDHISGDLFLGGDLHQALTLIENNSIPSTDLKIFIGYCGWDENELEAELNEESWHVCEASPAIALEKDPSNFHQLLA